MKKISLLLLTLLFLLTACQSMEKSPEYDTIAGAHVTYYFEKGYLQKEPMEALVTDIDDAFEKLSKILNRSAPADAAVYIGNFSESTLVGNTLHLSNLANRTTNYGVWVARLLLAGKSVPKWYASGLGYHLGKAYFKGNASADVTPDCAAKKEIQTELDENTLATYIPYFAEDNFSPSSHSYQGNLIAASNYVSFLAEKVEDKALLTVLEDFSKFEEIFGKNELALRSEWLTRLGFDSTFVFEELLLVTPSNAFDDEGFYIDFPQKITLTNQIYYFTEEKSADEMFSSIQKIHTFLDKSTVLLRGAQIFVDTGSIPQRYAFGKKISQPYLIDRTEKNVQVSSETDLTPEVLADITLTQLTPNSSFALLHVGLKTLLAQKEAEQFSSEALSAQAKTALMSLDLPTYFGVKNPTYDVSSTEAFKDDYAVAAADFCSYLEETYGMDVLLRLYRDPLMTINEVHLPFNHLCRDWLAGQGFTNESTTFLSLEGALTPLPISNVPASFQVISDERYEKTETDHFTFAFETGVFERSEMYRFTLQSERAFEDISAYLTPQYIVTTDKLNLTLLGDDGISEALDNDISLASAQTGTSEYAHEITHSLAGATFPYWVSEGFATYVDTLFTTNFDSPTGGEDLHKLARFILFEEPDFQFLLDFADTHFRAPRTQHGQNVRMRAYIISASLCRYIEETYGKEKLLAFHINADDPETVLGVSFETLKENWLSSLQNDNSPL